ncbi:GNAT family N-acetyltransferase [Sporolactobacillus shoreicorticis]|uniref:GNAT family N-acetyltransferase n=1 Tax=Sporolactobacillus shoreicorticis TaxID=1923877 RepID=A0ABW5S742_9BACL|nr:GNAT family N-acetyltransferase [Sporolactobacillus shoreicorticis]MCO7125752.1 GNAT family N-acetyltransferase [Sporolactobacillus shoreicorticis]
MIINQHAFTVKRLHYTIRSAVESDAERLSELRAQIDGETEHMDRRGEALIDREGFIKIIKIDTNHPRNLFLVAEVDGRLAGYSRCASYELKRFAHKVEFGLGVLKHFWGFGIGKKLMKKTISWADTNGVKKIVLIVLNGVLETNKNAIELYKKLGFEIEGLIKKDRILSDGKYYYYNVYLYDGQI